MYSKKYLVFTQEIKTTQQLQILFFQPFLHITPLKSNFVLEIVSSLFHKTMKKTLLLFCLLSAGSLHAQQKPHTWSVTPRIGANFSTIYGDFSEKVSWFTGNEEGVSATAVKLTDKNFKAGVVGAVDVKYQFNPTLGLSLGVSAESVGTRFADYHSDLDGVVNDITIGQMKLIYTEFPVLLHAYVYRGLSVNAGLQSGLLVSQKFSWELNGLKDSRNTDYRKYSVALPIGFSYEFGNFLLDLRYCLGLTKIRANENMIGNMAPKNHLHNIQLSVGYKL